MTDYSVKKQYREILEHLRQCQADDSDWVITFERGDRDRTPKQSASRWIYLEQVANALNEKGFDQVAIVELMKSRPKIEVQNTKDSLYATVWVPVVAALYPEKSARGERLNTKEIQIVYEAINLFFAKEFGISFPWPDRFNQGE